MEAVKERPLIMTGKSVRRTFADIKTNTRRVAKGLEKFDHIEHLINRQTGEYFWRCWTNAGGEWDTEDITCPHGQPGDRLWIKEAYFVDHEIGEGTRGEVSPGVFYKATDEGKTDYRRGLEPWKTPLFMPKRFSRLTIQIKDVKLERVCNISAEDARKEGYDDINNFFESWDQLNAKRGFSAESNPFVWVIEYERIKQGCGNGEEEKQS